MAFLSYGSKTNAWALRFAHKIICLLLIQKMFCLFVRASLPGQTSWDLCTSREPSVLGQLFCKVWQHQKIFHRRQQHQPTETKKYKTWFHCTVVYFLLVVHRSYNRVFKISSTFLFPPPQWIVLPRKRQKTSRCLIIKF